MFRAKGVKAYENLFIDKILVNFFSYNNGKIDIFLAKLFFILTLSSLGQHRSNPHINFNSNQYQIMFFNRKTCKDRNLNSTHFHKQNHVYIGMNHSFIENSRKVGNIIKTVDILHTKFILLQDEIFINSCYLKGAALSGFSRH